MQGWRGMLRERPFWAHLGCLEIGGFAYSLRHLGHETRRNQADPVAASGDPVRKSWCG